MSAYTLPEPAVGLGSHRWAYDAAQMQAAYEAGLAQSEPQTAFCPACFVAVALDECDAEARDAKLWREHVAGLRAAPEGRKLVPIEPTPEMIAAALQDADKTNYYAARGYVDEDIYLDGYRAMIAAAPEMLK